MIRIRPAEPAELISVHPETSESPPLCDEGSGYDCEDLESLASQLTLQPCRYLRSSLHGWHQVAKKERTMAFSPAAPVFLQGNSLSFQGRSNNPELFPHLSQSGSRRQQKRQKREGEMFGKFCFSICIHGVFTGFREGDQHPLGSESFSRSGTVKTSGGPPLLKNPHPPSLPRKRESRMPLKSLIPAFAANDASAGKDFFSFLMDMDNLGPVEAIEFCRQKQCCRPDVLGVQISPICRFPELDG